ncbi:hypothetical protein Tco_0214483 [Tanacetum coccineum]
MSSDEASSRVAYTSISSDYKEPSYVGSPEVVVYGYDGLPMHPVDPPSSDYVPGSEEPEQAPLSPDYDEEEAFEEDKEEEEEHLAPAYSTAAASPVVDPVPSAEETEPFETDESIATPPPPPAYRTTARMSIRAQTPIPFPFEAEVDRLLAIPTPPPSSLTPLSSLLPQIPSPPFPIPSPPTTSPTYTKAPLGYNEAGIRLRTASPPPLPLSSPLPLPPPIILLRTRASMVLMRAAAPSTYILAPRSRTPPSGIPPILPIPLPTSSLPLPSTDYRVDVPEAVLTPRKRLYIASGPRFEVEESYSTAAARSTFKADYSFLALWMPRLDVTQIERQDTDKIYIRLNDAQSDRSLMTGQLNMLHRDRRYHANTALLVEREARVAQEAWAQSMDASHRARSKVMTLQTTVSALQTENKELRTVDRRRQTQLLEALNQVRALQTQIVVLQRQRIEDSDRLTRHIQHEHDRFREFQRTRDVAPEDADISS